MNAPQFDLLGDPLPEPLPENMRLIDFDDLAGHTVAAVIENPAGRRQSALVIITTTRCWLVLKVDEAADCCDSSSIEVERVYHQHGKPEPTLHDYCSAADLRAAGILRAGEYEALRAVEVEREAKANADRAARLRAEADKLAPITSGEGGKP